MAFHLPTTTRRHQIDYFATRSYVPDSFGYGDTDKPDCLIHYRAKTMCDDLVKVIDYEHVDRTRRGI